jgi:hypothetical protein
MNIPSVVFDSAVHLYRPDTGAGAALVDAVTVGMPVLGPVALP